MNVHFFSRDIAGTSMPLSMNILLCGADLAITWAMSGRGLWTPSYIVPRRPGPSSTLSGEPVPSTGSPGFRPVVDS